MTESAEPAKREPFNPVRFLRETRQELARVTWPTRKETTVSTIMVLVLVLIAALFFIVVDTVIGSAVQWILGIGN